MFNVGDIIIGTHESDKIYWITNSTTLLKVVAIISSKWIKVELVNKITPFDESVWSVESEYFKLYKESLFYCDKENKLSSQKINNNYKEII